MDLKCLCSRDTLTYNGNIIKIKGSNVSGPSSLTRSSVGRPLFRSPAFPSESSRCTARNYVPYATSSVRNLPVTLLVYRMKLRSVFNNNNKKEESNKTNSRHADVLQNKDRRDQLLRVFAFFGDLFPEELK